MTALVRCRPICNCALGMLRQWGTLSNCRGFSVPLCLRVSVSNGEFILYGVEDETGRILPLKYLWPFNANSEINAAISFA